MRWQEYVVERKFSVIALMVAIVMFGIFAKASLPIDLFPNTSPPMVNIITVYPGASAQDVARDVTEVIEEEMITVSGVETVKSTSQDGLSVITVEFSYGTDGSRGTIDIQNAINRIRYKLPGSMQEPRIVEVDVSDKPIMTLALTSDRLNMMEVRDIADNGIKTRLQLIEGVAAVDVFGSYKAQLQVKLLPEKLRRYNLTPQQVIGAISKNNITFPGGKIKDEDTQLGIRIDGQLGSQEHIRAMPVAKIDGKSIYLRDVAEIAVGPEEATSSFRHMGHEAIAIQIIKKDGTNTVDVAQRVREELKRIEKDFSSLNIEVADDGSQFTMQVVDNMTSSIVIALFLTVLIIMMFVLSFHKALAVSVSIPLSYLLTLSLMKLFGMQFDLITLSAIILSIGIVVDNAIVVVENISRHNEELGKSLIRAAIDGASEITLSVAAGTATTLIVMVPLIFIEGFVGKVFGPLAKTIIFSIGSSLIVSLSIIPLFLVLTSGINFRRMDRWVKWVGNPFTSAMERLKRLYLGLLDAAMQAPTRVLTVTFLLLGVSGAILTATGMDVLPKLDTGTFSIWIQTQDGMSLDRTVGIAEQVEGFLKEDGDVISYYTQTGYEPGTTYMGENGAMTVNQARISVQLTSRKERRRTIWEIEEQLRDRIALLPYINTFVVKEEGGTAVATSKAPIDIRISGSDPRVLEALASDAKEQIRKVQGAKNIYLNWSGGMETVVLDLKKTRLDHLGMDAETVANQVFQSMEGIQVSELRQERADDMAIMVKYPERERMSKAQVGSIVISTPTGVAVPLRDIAIIRTDIRPNLVTRENLSNTIDILGFTHERPLSHVAGDIEAIINGIGFPRGYAAEMVGDRAELAASSRDIAFALLIAIISVYLLLMAQFRSALYPITIMASIPLALIGVVMALRIAGKVISMPVMLGFILLAGTVVNNAILLLDAINMNREQGVGVKEAIRKGVETRFRPIMMTALSDVAGMLPLALELALGSERFSPLAVTIIGGILAATFLTMIIIPVVYIQLERVCQRVSSLWQTGMVYDAEETTSN
ncbi:MAG: efflux RND transporter permease subunit [Bacillota bacterium]|nr:efflux RND transporter permease subunit [Bacillota bacterium]